MILIYRGGIKLYFNHRGEGVCMGMLHPTAKIHVLIEMPENGALVIRELLPLRRLRVEAIEGGVVIEADKNICVTREGHKIHVDYIVLVHQREDEVVIDGIQLRTGDAYDFTHDVKVKRMHAMHVDDRYFWSLVSGEKSIEGRLYDERRRRIMKGDHVRMFCDEGYEAYFLVKDVRVYDSFREMLLNEGLDNVLPGIKEIEKGVEVYRKFYSEKEEKRYGVCAIELEPL